MHFHSHFPSSIMRLVILIPVLFFLFPSLSCIGHSLAASATTENEEYFTVTDERAPEEISETTRLYVNGHLAATFHLGLNHDLQQTRLSLPAGSISVTYTLCGQITIIHNGHAETHQVSSEGNLYNPNGHHYDAIGTDHFSDFFLIDYDDPSAADHISSYSSLCAISCT